MKAVGFMIVNWWMLSTFIKIALGSEFLDAIEIQFKLSGNISFIPSYGGVQIPGYKLSISYNKYQWIGVRFKSETSTHKHDVIIVQRSSVPSEGKYLCTYTDYSTTISQTNVLIPDVVNNQDYFVSSNSNSNQFGLQILRTKGRTNGQDWEGGQFVDICFFTSSKVFHENTWTSQFQVCYGYSIDGDYQSTLAGKYLKSITFEGVETLIYGGMLGPVQKVHLFALIQKPNLILTSLYLKLGGKIKDSIGYDYCHCSNGDYHGWSTTTLIKDIRLHGYEDGSCSILRSNQTNRITYSRYACTSDEYDSILGSNMEVCFIASTEVCTNLELPNIFPSQSVRSAVKIWEFHMTLSSLLICILIFYL